MADQVDKYSKKIFPYIGIISSFIILFYAYLYFIGYLYLLSYFKFWGLNPIELGFSIVDFATVAMYPFFWIAAFSFAGIVMGFSSNMVSNKKIRFIFLIISSLVPIYWIIKSIKSNTFLLLILFICFLYFFWWIFIYKQSKSRNKKYIGAIGITIFFLVMAFTSSTIGGEMARLRRTYTINNIAPDLPQDLPKVIICSNSPISGLELFETEKNRYEYLNLLANRNDFYYLVADLEHHEPMCIKIWKHSAEIMELRLNIEELLDKQSPGGKSVPSEIPKQMLDDAKIIIDEIQKSPKISLKKQIEMIQELKLNIFTAVKLLSDNPLILTRKESENPIIKEDMITYNTKLQELNKLIKIYDSIFYFTLAIKKDQIAYISYPNSMMK